MLCRAMYGVVKVTPDALDTVTQLRQKRARTKTRLLLRIARVTLCLQHKRASYTPTTTGRHFTETTRRVQTPKHEA